MERMKGIGIEMDIQNIITLIDAVSKADIKNFEIEEGNFRLSMDKLSERRGAMQVVTQGIPAAQAAPILPVQAVPAAVPPVAVEINSMDKPDPVKKIASSAEAGDQNVKEIKSPIVGTFYSASGPDTEDFVKAGDSVKKGQTLCIIEAMKLMNDIESEYDGIVTEILVKNQQMVEYGQPLFKIKVS